MPRKTINSQPRLHDIRRDEGGQAVVMLAVCMVVIIGFLGLGIDVGHLRLVKRNLQNAADAAALAAGLELRVCGGVTNCPAMQAAAQNAVTESGLAGATLITNCSATAGSGLTLMLNNPSCAIGAADPNSGNKRYVEAIVSTQARTYFARILGYDNVPISARAEAKRNPGQACIYALDPSGAGAISVIAAVGIQSQCGVVDESSSASALACVVGVLISAPKVSVNGGTAGVLCSSTPAPATNVARPTPNDPLAYLPTPTVGACGTSAGSPYFGSSSNVTVSPLGNTVFNPGVYCGGITIAATVAGNITFNPGTYILKTGPGLLGIPSGGLNIGLGLLSNISGTGVTFYNLGPVGGISITAATPLSLSNLNLTAPTSGTYGGILFFQDSSNTTPGVFLASLASGNKLNGAIYMPSAFVSYAVGAVSSAYTILVAKDINFTAPIISSFGDDYSSLSVGSPLNGDAAVLVQ